MKWRNHEAIGYAISYAVTGNLLLSLVSIPMSVMPDAIEGPPKMKWIKHRGKSHSILLWCALCTIGVPIAWIFPASRPALAVTIIGILSHLICDSMTYMGIPYKENEVLSLRLFPTGSPVEYFIAFVTLVSAFGFRHFYFHQLQIPSVNEAMDEIRYIFYVLTQPHFASWLISIMPYNILSLIALVVGVWMAVFRGLHSFGMGLIVIAIALFFYGQAIN